MAWESLYARTGGDLSLSVGRIGQQAAIASLYLEVGAVQELIYPLKQGTPIAPALQLVLQSPSIRAIIHPSLAVFDDPQLRILQVLTSLQRGGAERIALDLFKELNSNGWKCQLASLGQPTRTPFEAPANHLRLATVRGGRAARIQVLAKTAIELAVDLLHVHLLDQEEMARLAGTGLPVVATVHNQQPGWPAGLNQLEEGQASLIIACSGPVERELRTAGISVPIRTVWNGIDSPSFQRTPASRAAGLALRHRLDIPAEALVLVALANPRPQKRLHLLPAILAALQHYLRDRSAYLLVAGEGSPRSELAVRANAELRAEIDRSKLQDRTRLLGSVQDVPELLAAADVLVSTSAYEGLSLAHLEALAAGVPVVSTDVGGTREIARDHTGLAMVPVDASVEQFATAIVESIGRTADSSPLAPSFTLPVMAERYRWLYPRALAARRRKRPGKGILLVTNNFSSGGAQSSARRLLVGLSASGVPCRAVVLEEQASYPTPGRLALESAGVSILTLPPASSLDAAEAVGLLLEDIDRNPPRAVLFWNALAGYKVMLADALLDVPLFDVSPGEMYFTSLDRYFARPRAGFPYRSPADYGARLAGAVVKYVAEASRARETLECPVHVIPNGVPVPHAPPPLPAQGKRLVLGTLARINPQKKLEELLLALKEVHEQLPPYLLRIGGSIERGGEPYSSRLHNLALGLHVDWCGEITDTAGFLAGLDIFVLVAEPAGCPNASLEAMAAGRPVIATDVGGIGEQIEIGATGQITPRGDASALGQAIRDLCHDADCREDWGRAGHARAAQHFSVQTMIDRYRALCLPD